MKKVCQLQVQYKIIFSAMNIQSPQPDSDAVLLSCRPGFPSHTWIIAVRSLGTSPPTLSQRPKVIDYPRYNMKCSGENVIQRGIFHVVSRFPLLYMLYRGNFYCFSDSAPEPTLPPPPLQHATSLSTLLQIGVKLAKARAVHITNAYLMYFVSDII